MTAREFSEVDHDLLADYIGGALDGTPEHATVARLVEDNPAWGGAYATLAPAVESARADLAGWAASPAPQMPLAVADRIAAALSGAGPAPALASGKAPADTGEQVDDGNAGGTGATDRAGRGAAAGGGIGRTGGTSRPPEGPHRTGPSRRPRRWTRITGPVALAAAALTAVGLGVNHLVTAQVGGEKAVTARSGREGQARPTGAPGPLAATSFRTTGPVQRSGRDYTPEQLTGMIRPGLAPPAGSTARTTAAAPGDERLSPPGGLDRLAGREALDACLGAISTEHAGGPLTVDLVDYASFRGQPALVVTFVDAGGARWAWVSGAECGVPGSGADTRFRTRVG